MHAAGAATVIFQKSDHIFVLWRKQSPEKIKSFTDVLT